MKKTVIKIYIEESVPAEIIDGFEEDLISDLRCIDGLQGLTKVSRTQEDL